MTSLDRVLTTLGFKEPDRVPFFLLLTMHGAQELGLCINDYYSNAEYVIEGQRRLLEKYQDDCLLNFTYASLETEAWGGETIFSEDGPPNAGEPIIKKPDDINSSVKMALNCFDLLKFISAFFCPAAAILSLNSLFK